jgi:hypothetical protein
MKKSFSSLRNLYIILRDGTMRCQRCVSVIVEHIIPAKKCTLDSTRLLPRLLLEVPASSATASAGDRISCPFWLLSQLSRGDNALQVFHDITSTMLSSTARGARHGRSTPPIQLPCSPSFICFQTPLSPTSKPHRSKHTL